MATFLFIVFFLSATLFRRDSEAARAENAKLRAENAQLRKQLADETPDAQERPTLRLLPAPEPIATDDAEPTDEAPRTLITPAPVELRLLSAAPEPIATPAAAKTAKATITKAIKPTKTAKKSAKKSTSKKLTRKQKLQQTCRSRGIRYTQKMTIAQLQEAITKAA